MISERLREHLILHFLLNEVKFNKINKHKI